MKSNIKFSSENTLFSKVLKQRIKTYFEKEGKSKNGDRRLFIKATILLGLALIQYYILVFLHPYWLISIFLCISFGINLATIGFNIMHDAGHGSFSIHKKANILLSYSLNLMGGNIYFWKLKHNIAHHTYTNINGEDHDIDIKFIRIHPDQPLRNYHQFQPIYFLFLYSLSYLAWVFYQDYEKYFNQRLAKGSDLFHFPLSEKIIFWLSKILHFTIFLIIPYYNVGLWQTCLGILIIGVACGLCLATVFQLAHVVSDTVLQKDRTSKIQEQWMTHQLNSTANFATSNKKLTWLLGGLNFQVEHHLFPKVSHIHYPAINNIVKETSKQFGIRYVEYATFGKAFLSHRMVIRKMSE